MRISLENFRISRMELIYFGLGVLVLLLWGIVASGQTGTQPMRAAKGAAPVKQIQQQVYREYRGVRLGMSAAEARAKLGEPTMKSDEQDFYVISPGETAQLVYIAQKVVTISTDYTDGVGAPDYRSVVGAKLEVRPDGSSFKMMPYESEHFWVSYNKSATIVPVVTITIGILK